MYPLVPSGTSRVAFRLYELLGKQSPASFTPLNMLNTGIVEGVGVFIVGIDAVPRGKGSDVPSQLDVWELCGFQFRGEIACSWLNTTHPTRYPSAKVSL